MNKNYFFQNIPGLTGIVTAISVTGCTLLTGCAGRNNSDLILSANSSESFSASQSADQNLSSSSNETVIPTAAPSISPTVTPTVTPDPETTGEAVATPEAAPEPEPAVSTEPVVIGLDENWEFASCSAIHTGSSVLYRAADNRRNITIGVNAGHGTSGGSSVQTYCHPDQSPKVTGGSTQAGAVTATAIATGMEFYDGAAERDVTLQEAQILKDLLLSAGFDVLMVRDDTDVQLDNIARSVMCNNCADCHIALHWDGDLLDYDKGCYFDAVPDALKTMYPVSTIWEASETLGSCLIDGLASNGCLIFDSGQIDADLTQTSYSTVPSVDIELGNAASDHSTETLTQLAQGLLSGIEFYYGS